MVKYIELTFLIDSEPEPQPAKVRPGLTVNDMIAEIVREFELGTADGYDLYRDKKSSPLIRAQSLEAQQVRDGQTLVFMRSALAHRKPIQAKQKAALELLGSNKKYVVQWQPAVIGRPDSDPVHSSLLAVNLDWHANNRRISRRHAQIVEDNGVYYVECLAPNNPVFLNGHHLKVGERYPLQHRDRISLRNSKVDLRFLLSKQR